MEKLALEEITLQASIIVQGTARDGRETYRPHHTQVKIPVKEIFDGQPDQAEITVVVPGGRTGGESLRQGCP
ncbi:MAG: hypothetical protein HY871_08505 [Chloroflexi bacterium]|nr:hypothetical protein [Chloroflexota bacterium]